METSKGTQTGKLVLNQYTQPVCCVFTLTAITQSCFWQQQHFQHVRQQLFEATCRCFSVFKALFTSCCLPTCFSLFFKNCLRVQHQLKNLMFIFKKTQLKRFINVMLKHVDEPLGMGCSASHKPLSFSNARKLKMTIK